MLPNSSPELHRKRFRLRASRWLRYIAVLTGLLLVLFIGATACLYLYGVPPPFLRFMERKLGDKGIPLLVDSVKLTSRGWKLSNVRYYSMDPDDLNPILSAKTVFMKRNHGGDEGKIRAFDIRADGLVASPSAEWIIGLPPSSELCQIDYIDLGLGIASDTFVVRDATLKWMRTSFHVEGSVVNIPEVFPEGVPWYQHLLPVVITDEDYRQIENELNSLELNDSATIDIRFLLDQADPAQNTARIAAGVDEPVWRGVEFSRIELLANYENQCLYLDHASLIKNNQSLVVAGEYNGNTGRSRVSFRNQITSNQLFALLPGMVIRAMEAIGLTIESFPSVEISAEGASPADLIAHVSGAFSMDRLTFQGVEAAPIAGRLEWDGSRLSVHEINTHIVGQEEQSEARGSCMKGGAVTGGFFWDTSTYEFGVAVDSECDPVLLLEPLSFNYYATNILAMFRFPEQPPKVHLELGARLEEVDSFHLDLHAVASDAVVRGSVFTAVDASAAYRQGVLQLDPVVAKQGIQYVKGSVALDFRRSEATFEGGGTIPPESIERLIDPGIMLFGKYLKVSGPSKIDARGTVDWHDMSTTSFQAEIDLQELETPVALMDKLTATILAEGPVIRTEDMLFSAYQGNGTGELSLHVDPSGEGIPCKMDVSMDGINLQQWLKFIRPDEEYSVSGKLSTSLLINTDLTRHFFEVANGSGRMEIKDGQLADLPFFSGLTRLVRLAVPSFKVFSIDEVKTDFELKDGAVFCDDAYFGGDLLSAKGHGKYSRDEGLDAYVQVQLLNDSKYLKLFRMLTDPFLKLLELKLEGTFSNPSWQLNAFSSDKN